jgi:hypothetical protein
MSLMRVGGHIASIALIFTRLASISWYETKELARGDPEHTFVQV